MGEIPISVASNPHFWRPTSRFLDHLLHLGTVPAKGLLMNLLQDPIEAAVLAVLPLLLEPAHQAAPRVR